MFFLARSVFCIGLVAFMLPASQRPDDWRALADTARVAATEHLASLCSETPSSCIEANVAKLVLSGAIGGGPSSVAARKSVSTLQPMDLVPTWRGPLRS